MSWCLVSLICYDTHFLLTMNPVLVWFIDNKKGLRNLIISFKKDSGKPYHGHPEEHKTSMTQLVLFQ